VQATVGRSEASASSRLAELVSYGDYSIESGARAASALLDLARPPTAIFAANDDMAIGAMNEAKARGLLVPSDISVVGFDDITFAASYDPPLTTVHQPFFDMGTAAMDTLYELLRGQAPAPRIRLLPTELMIRQTTAKPTSVTDAQRRIAPIIHGVR
jgi:DNA-binding LacI/PurR family transcriptional regulator